MAEEPVEVHETARRRPLLAMAAFHAAWLLAMLAALSSITTYVPEIERSALKWACGLAATSVGLVTCSWSRMPRGLRFLGVGVIVLAALGGIYAGSRLLGVG